MSKFGVPTDNQLAKINKLAKRTLSKDEVFVFPTKLAGDMIIPDRHVQLTKELLDVFVLNVNQGIAFLLDHSWHADGFWGLGGRPKAAIPYGRTFEGSVDPSNDEGEEWALNGFTYMKRDVTLDGISTNDLIASIEAGTLFDTSIGFSYNKAICSICGNDYTDYDECNHVAGKTYEVEDEDGVTKNVLCYIKACPPGALWENSGVFDGAYPGAGVMSKAGDILENENGKFQVITELKGIDPGKPVIATYSERTGLLTMVKKSDHKKIYASGIVDDPRTPIINGINGLVKKAQDSITDRDSIFALGERIGVSKEQVLNIANIVLGKNEKGDEKKMDEKLLKIVEDFGIAYKEGETTAEELLSQIAEKWDSTVPPQEGFNPEEYLAIPVKEIEEKLSKDISVDEILKLAKEGQEYRQQVIDDAIAMGIRAHGNDFPAETWKSTFASMETKAIKDIMKTFEAQVKDEIPAGRKTEPGLGLKSTEAPDEAYKVKK